MAVAGLGKLNFEEPPPIWGSPTTRSVDCFEKLQQIGEGTHGQVYKAKDIRTGEIVALKKIRMCEIDGYGIKFPTTAIQEIKILKKLDHENVIRLKEVVTSSGRDRNNQFLDKNKNDDGIYMVFEYMEHDLAGLSDRPGMIFTISQIKCYMKQLLLGLHYCHLNQILHRDVKAANLLIDNKGNLKLADFGLARSYIPGYTDELTNLVITLWYRPPELLLGATVYGPEVDMWSFGCVLAELLIGKPIFPGKNESDQLNKIYELCGTPDRKNWPGVSNLPLYNQFKSSRPLKRCLTETYRSSVNGDALRLLENLLVLDPSKRISARDALDDDYFWNKPLPCDPKSIRSYESSHVFQIKNKREAMRLQKAAAKKQ